MITGGGGGGGDRGSDDWESNNSAPGGAGGTGAYKANGGNGGNKDIDASSGGPTNYPGHYTGGSGNAYPSTYVRPFSGVIYPSSGEYGVQGYVDNAGVDVGGGGGGAAWYGSGMSTTYPYAGRGGNGAYNDTNAGKGFAGNGILGGGGGGGGGAIATGEVIAQGRQDIPVYRVAPGGNGGSGYVHIIIGGATIV